MVALLLVAVSLGLSNFAGSVAIGLSASVTARLRTKLAIIFGLFEGGMPIVGLLIGRQLAHAVGSRASLIAGLLLAATGVYTLVEALRAETGDGTPLGSELIEAGVGRRGMVQLIITGAALSLDNLAAGFALGAYNVSLPGAAVLIAVVSVAMSLVGLELGDRLGQRVERGSGVLGGLVLIAVGVAIAVKVV